MLERYQQKATLKQLCNWMSLPRSSYYYSPSNKRRGVRPNTATLKADSVIVPNTEVVDAIKNILSGEFVCYGYQKVTMQFKQDQFIINHKKVYRLMDENSLLLGKSLGTN